MKKGEEMTKLSDVLNELYETVDAVMEKARKEFPNLDLPDLKVLVDLQGKTAGEYFKDKKTKLYTVRFNLMLYAKNRKKFLAQTVPHEIAHHISRTINPWCQPHGGEWQLAMVALGAEPKRCHDYEVPKVKRMPRPYKYDCGCTLHYFTSRRHRNAQSGTVYKCSHCGGTCRFVGIENEAYN